LVTGGSHSGAPDVLRISAESTDLAEAFRQKRERSFHQQTIAEIFQALAFDYGLKVMVHSSLSSRKVSHIDQNDSDANIMTRIADEHDAIATSKTIPFFYFPLVRHRPVQGSTYLQLNWSDLTVTNTHILMGKVMTKWSV
jgi:phage protein D